MIEFECPACEATIRVGENAVGKKGRCPKCQTLLLVPDPDDFEDDEEPEPEQEAEPEPEPVPKPEPEAEPDSEPVIIVTEPAVEAAPVEATPVEVPAVATPEPKQPPPESEPEPPAPVAADPENPFAFATGPSVVARAASGRHGRRRGRTTSSLATKSILAVLAGVFVLLLGTGLLYLLLKPDLSGTLTGERFKDVDLPAVTFAGPSNVPADDLSAVRDVLENEGLPLTSEYIGVTIDAVGGKPRVLIEPGPQAVPVRIALGRHEGIQAVLANEREHITKVKQQELKTATANLYRDYAAYLDDGTSMSKLPEYRNQVALNAAVGPAGYAVEAVVSGYPFLCVYEDAEGYCYYFLPEGVQSFQLRGRQLPDGSTPLPVEIEVTLTDAAPPVIAEPETGDKPEAKEPAKKEDATPKDGEKEPPKDDEKPESTDSDDLETTSADE